MADNLKNITNDQVQKATPRKRKLRTNSIEVAFEGTKSVLKILQLINCLIFNISLKKSEKITSHWKAPQGK